MSLEHFFDITKHSIASLFWKSLAFEKVKTRVPETTNVLFLYIYYGFFNRNYGIGCHPRTSRGAYFPMFKVNCNTLSSRRLDFSRMNFALNSRFDRLVLERVNIGVSECGDCFSAPKHANRCGAQLLFKRYFIYQGIDWLILNLESHSHFCCSTELD